MLVEHTADIVAQNDGRTIQEAAREPVEADRLERIVEPEQDRRQLRRQPVETEAGSW